MFVCISELYAEPRAANMSDHESFTS